MGTTQRLDKILANSGYGTRKEIKQLVREGSVKVDGVTADDSGTNDGRLAHEMLSPRKHVPKVKRMFEAAGKKVKYLRRIGMGNLKLDETLRTGECRELTDAEIALLKSV